MTTPRHLWSDAHHLKARAACLLASLALVASALAAGAAPAHASSGIWCYDISLAQGNTCYSTHESNLRSIEAWSEESLTWAWLYNDVASPDSKSGYCSAVGCTEDLGLNATGYGYQELKAYSEPLSDPDLFFGVWSS